MFLDYKYKFFKNSRLIWQDYNQTKIIFKRVSTLRKNYLELRYDVNTDDPMVVKFWMRGAPTAGILN